MTQRHGARALKTVIETTPKQELEAAMNNFRQSEQNKKLPEQRQTQQTPRPPRHGSIEEWFWWLVGQVVELRGCHISASHAREEAILRQLQDRGFNAMYAPAAEQWILYGSWPTTKILRVGLELADFYPDTIAVTREELERIQRRIYAAAREYTQEVVRKQRPETDAISDAEKPIIEQYKQAFEDLNKALLETQDERNSLQQRYNDKLRDIESLKRREERLLQQCVSLSNQIELLKKEVSRLEAENEHLKNEVNDLFNQGNSSENVGKTAKTGEFWDILEESDPENPS